MLMPSPKRPVSTLTDEQRREIEDIVARAQAEFVEEVLGRIAHSLKHGTVGGMGAEHLSSDKAPIPDEENSSLKHWGVPDAFLVEFGGDWSESL